MESPVHYHNTTTTTDERRTNKITRSATFVAPTSVRDRNDQCPRHAIPHPSPHLSRLPMHGMTRFIPPILLSCPFFSSCHRSITERRQARSRDTTVIFGSRPPPFDGPNARHRRHLRRDRAFAPLPSVASAGGRFNSNATNQDSRGRACAVLQSTLHMSWPWTSTAINSSSSALLCCWLVSRCGTSMLTY